MSDHEGYKVVGELDDGSGAGVFGHNTATSGDAVGVEGRTESEDGYGLYTDDDAHVGSELTAGAVEADELNSNHVLDTSGRVHGELTGNNDAQVVIDAIDDRQGTAGIVVPDPGFALDWEQEVDLPKAERGFSIDSVGVPRLTFPSDFDGEYAIHKPANADKDNKEGTRQYRIGEFIFDDEKEVLSRGIYLDDSKGGLIRPCAFYGTPGIKVGSSNWWPNQNMILRPIIISNRGPGIEMERRETTDDYETDQNWIVAPFFSEGKDFDGDGYTETAYLDHGRANMWLFSRCEFAKTVHKQVGAHRYVIYEGQWDRYKLYQNTVKEVFRSDLDSPQNDVHGTVVCHRSDHFALSRLINSHTMIESSGRTKSTTEFLGLTNLTTAHSLASKGLRDASDGGSVTTLGGRYFAPTIRLQTDGASGDTAVLDTGGTDTWGSAELAPKLFLDVEVDTNEDVLVRVGFYGSEDNRAELIYDPNQVLGSYSDIDSTNWYVELVTDGQVRGRSDTGVDAWGYGRRLVLQREGVDEAKRNGLNWSAIVQKGNVSVVSNDGVALAPNDDPEDPANLDRFGFRVYVESLADTTKTVDIEGQNRKLLGLTE